MNGLRRKYRRQLNVVYVSMDKEDGRELARQHGVVGTPTLLLLDREGRQANILRGSLPSAVMEQAVKELLRQEIGNEQPR